MNLKLFVIIVTYNGMKWIDRCITSVLNATVKSEILLIDNGSTDGTKEYVASTYKNVITLPNSVNLGFGKANNIGIQYALEHSCDYVYLLNQDAWVDGNTFQILIETLERNSQYGVVSPLQVTASKTKLDKNFAKYCSIEHCPDLLDALLLHRTIKEVYDVDFIMAAHWMITRKCIEKIGGFNPVFPHYGEDENFLHRVSFHGFKKGICPLTISVHDREYRVVTKKHIHHMNYIEYVKIASNINTTSFFKLKKILRNLITTLRLCCTSFSLIPLLGLGKFIFQIKQIVTANKIARKGGFAFLEHWRKP